MKKISKLLTIILVTFTFLNVNAQQNSILKHNESYYKDKKVKDLVEDLKIDIKIAAFDGGWSEEQSFISLRFDDKKHKIIIFIKEQDPKTNNLFLNKNSNTLRKVFRDDHPNNTNIKMLSQYLGLTITHIYIYCK